MKGGLEDKMVNYLFEKGADLFPLAKRAEGLYLETADGKRYLDFASATFNLSLGYSHPDVVQAVKDLLDTGLSYVSTSFKLDVISAFAKKLVSLCPDNLTRVHLKCTGGSTANEGAIKAALKVTGKNDLVTYYYGYHGQTYLTQALTGYHLQRNYLPPIGLNVIRIPFPYCYRCFFGKKYPDCAIFCLKKIAQILDSSSTDGPACLIMEPILGIGGCVVPPKRYMKGIAKFC